jgi:predicted glycosyltransferase
MRVLFHVQHLLGIGHVKRAAALVRGLRRAGIDVTVLSGGEPVSSVDFESELVQLPAARATDATFRTIVDSDGVVIDEAFKENRRQLVAATLVRVEPDLVLVESFPFGRRAFRSEMMALLESGRPVAVSLRDIVVAKDAGRTAEAVELVHRHVAAVLVHGDPGFIPLEASFPATAPISERLHYTGYVYEPPPEAVVPGGEVVVSAGGGAVGATLLEAALAARPLTRHRARPWRLIAGPNLPEAAFRRLEGRGAIVERFRDDFPQLLRHCAISVSQAGYNTVLDLLWARPPTVLVPFAAAAETEQSLRAARLGCEVVPEHDLMPERLAAAIDAARAPEIEVDLAGAERTASVLNLMFKGRM